MQVAMQTMHNYSHSCTIAPLPYIQHNVIKQLPAKISLESKGSLSFKLYLYYFYLTLKTMIAAPNAVPSTIILNLAKLYRAT